MAAAVRLLASQDVRKHFLHGFRIVPAGEPRHVFHEVQEGAGVTAGKFSQHFQHVAADVRLHFLRAPLREGEELVLSQGAHAQDGEPR